MHQEQTQATVPPPPIQFPFAPVSVQGTGVDHTQDPGRMSRPDPRDRLSIEVMTQYLTLMLHPNAQHE